ncbi:BRO family protein [Pelistega ratti]|uniref:BRO family protein n=1 Tax=Pelistega ratti TaxID=2652177 RepID=UPI001357BFF9|nr:BRO family protein [Pelistega ratti]
MSNITTFNFNNLPVRTHTDENNELWFCGTDVCDILGYINAPLTIQKHCREKGISKRYTLTPKGNQELTFINEPNLYRLIIKSRKVEAERFEEWVMEEVLPTIRKTGSYTTPTQATIAYEPKTHEVEDEVLHTLSDLLFLAHKQAEIFKKLYPALQAMLSQYAAEVFSLYTEPDISITLRERSLRELFTKLSKDDIEWRKTLHHFNEMFPIEKYNARLSRQQALRAVQHRA